MPAHAARPNRPWLAPALLIALVTCALGVLALLPGPAAAPRTLAAAAVRPVPLSGATQHEAVLGRPPTRLVHRAAPVRPAPRPVKRATRSKRLDVAVGGGYTCPIAAHVSFTDTWGEPRSGGRHHEGTDVLAAYGSPVVAVTSGVVKTAYSASGGISLYLRGDDGDEYFYAHNSHNVATTGQRVKAGQLIGYVGTSGNASGGPAHVHFERHPGGGGPVDPYPFLRRACG